MSDDEDVWTNATTSAWQRPADRYSVLDEMGESFAALDAMLQKHKAEMARLDPDGSKGRWLDLVTKEGASIVCHPEHAGRVRAALVGVEVIASPWVEMGQLLAIKLPR